MNEVSGAVHGPVVQADSIQGGVHFHGQDDKPQLDPIALYYPNVHVRDDVWLKYAALYWRRMGRLRPHRYPTNDSLVATELRGSWLVDVEPGHAATAVARPFLAVVADHSNTLRKRYGIQDADYWGVCADPYPWCGPMDIAGTHDLSPQLSYLHIKKVDPLLVEAVVAADLGEVVRVGRGKWLGMHPHLVSVYMCAVAEQVALSERVHPVTDQVLPHAALAGWSMDRLAGVLLGGQYVVPVQPGDPVDRFVITAFETVVPANMASVPISKIMEVRERYRRELNAFREYVTEQVAGLSRLNGVHDLNLYRAHLEHEVECKISDRLDDLREQLQDMGLEPGTALATVKTPVDVEGSGSDPGGSGAVATRVVDVPQRLRDKTIRNSPVGYLFHVGEQLSPQALADQVCDAMR